MDQWQCCILDLGQVHWHTGWKQAQIFSLKFSSQRLTVSELWFLSVPMFPRRRSTNGLITVPYKCNFEYMVTNLLLKNFWFAWYALLPRAILSLISSSIELLSFMMDPNYLHCRTLLCSYVTAGLAPRIIWPHKPQLSVKVDTPSGDLWTTKNNFSQAQLSTPWWWIARYETCWSDF